MQDPLATSCLHTQYYAAADVKDERSAWYFGPDSRPCDLELLKDTVVDAPVHEERDTACNERLGLLVGPRPCLPGF